jgi:hypothetical protein
MGRPPHSLFRIRKSQGQVTMLALSLDKVHAILGDMESSLDVQY